MYEVYILSMVWVFSFGGLRVGISLKEEEKVIGSSCSLVLLAAAPFQEECCCVASVHQILCGLGQLVLGG